MSSPAGTNEAPKKIQEVSDKPSATPEIDRLIAGLSPDQRTPATIDARAREDGRKQIALADKQILTKKV